MRVLVPHSRPAIGLEERRAVERVLRSGWIAQGPQVRRFEDEAAAFLGLKGGVALSSGTQALELVLRAMGVEPGHEVLIPSYACSALWHAVKNAGAEPVLLDCEPEGFNPSMQDAARKRTRRTKAVILPHLFGEPADLGRARRLGLPIVEDCAQALGARWNDRLAGGWGRACVLSFYATKLAVSGEGGMVLSGDRKLLERVRELREYDEKIPRRPMKNAKMTDLQAAMGRVQLGRLPAFLSARRRLASGYARALEGSGLRLPEATAGRVWFRYVVRAAPRLVLRLLARLEGKGIMVRRPVHRPLHWDVPCRGEFSGAERAWRESLSLPLYPSLTPREQRRVVQALSEDML